MRKLVLIALMLLCAVSCQSLPERLENFVSDVEANYPSYTEADWLVMEKKCEEFKLECAEKYERLNEFEKDYIGKAFVRYDAVVAKAKINKAVGGAKKFLENAGHYIEGLVEGLGGNEGQQVTDSL